MDKGRFCPTQYFCMAHRVFIRNLDQQQATKKTIALTFQEFGFYFVGLDQVQVVRSGGSSGSKASGRGQHCSAFVTLEDDHQVDTAVSAFDGKVIPLLSDRPLEAQPAIPRLTTLAGPVHMEVKKEKVDEGALSSTTMDVPGSSEPSPHGNVGVAIRAFAEMKQEDKDDLEEQFSSEPSTTGSVAVAVGHFVQTKEEDKRKKNPLPWARRQRLRAADVVE